MEGMFAFFLESALIGALIWGEKRLGPCNHFLAPVGVATGSWISGSFHPDHKRFHVTPNGLRCCAEWHARVV